MAGVKKCEVSAKVGYIASLHRIRVLREHETLEKLIDVQVNVHVIVGSS